MARTWHLAEINIARARAPLTDPIMADFVAALDGVNRLADESPGFVWRLKADGGAASSYLRFEEDERLIVNLSVWVSPEALHAFTYRSAHRAVFRDRRRWFEALDGPSLALWWLAASELPDVEDGRARLDRLRREGPTPDAFTFARPFPPPSVDRAGA